MVARLRKEAPDSVRELIPADARPESLRPGQSAREAGAWSWSLELTDGNLIGSQFTMKQIVSGKVVAFNRYFSDWNVDAGEQ